MSVKLRERKNQDGTTTQYLDIYQNGKRQYEFLKHLQLSKEANLIDRKHNKEKRDLAKQIAAKRAHELSANDYNISTDTGKKADVVEWMQKYIDKYKKKDKRNMQGALNRFKNFLIEDQKQGLTFGRLDELIITDFRDYLAYHSTGEGASSYFSRFKKMIRQAVREKVILSNPAIDVNNPKGKAKRKDILTLEEISLLSKTPTESEQVKKAFLFSCMTGLRWQSVSTIKWKNKQGNMLILRQDKTDEDVHINLNTTALQLIGEPQDSDELIFKLPTANGANKTLKAWVKRAGINKAITWHNARHSAGTNLALMEVDLLTISSLLGHTSTKHTQRYAKAAKELKERATDKLNISL